MRAGVLDGRALSVALLSALRPRVAALLARGVRPAIAIVTVGEDPATRVYVGAKCKAAGEVGVRVDLHALPESITQRELLALMAQLNAATDIHGILVQHPLPPELDAQAVSGAILPQKDVDGFHPRNLGAVACDEPGLRACTPAGILRLIDSAHIGVAGVHAVVVGRSVTVGKPVALMLSARGANVSICHSRTGDLAGYTRRADILVVAVGRPALVNGAMIKPGATVIDVGINRLVDGRLAGDVEFASAIYVAGLITPVPGGVGPMTVAMLLENTVIAAERPR